MLHVEKVPERCEDECCTPPPLILSSKPTGERRPLVQEVFRLEWITIGWMVIEAAMAIGSGIVSGSLVLLAFGQRHRVDFRRHAHVAAVGGASPWPRLF